MIKRTVLALLTLVALVATAAADFGMGPASWVGLYQPTAPSKAK